MNDKTDNKKNFSGIVNIYKEKDFTSHDVVAIVRSGFRAYGGAKVGHTGTLDPNATGVLPVCIGPATRLVDYIMDTNKTYKAEVLFGKTTDTYDITGEVLEEKENTNSVEEIEKVILSFVGGYEQVPPMYSALKHNGRKLYELAREGKEIEREARFVGIDKIDILELTKERAVINVDCTKGTYIRSLCHDIGTKLGCGAVMGDLERTQTGTFTKEDSITVDEFREYMEKGEFDKVLLSTDKMLSEYYTLFVGDKAKNYLINGNKISRNYVLNKNVEYSENSLYRVIDNEHNLYGLYKFENGFLLPQIRLYTGD